ncbi:MAG: hypothetical protein P1P88_22745 [Bacteroidales bacterium]|nr:hypothetical protein [Bacteroidales bacterium]
MKKNKLIITLILIFSMILPACVDIEVTTVLNADGSLERILKVNSDSELKDFSSLPFPIDSSWQLSYEHDTSANNNKSHRYIFKKQFSSVDELNNEYENSANSLKKLNRKLNVEKKFRWFYTYISYEEKYEKLALGDYRPFKLYLSDIEKEVYKYENSDSTNNKLNIDDEKFKILKSEIDKKYENWLTENIKDEVIMAIEQDFITNNIRDKYKADLKSKRDTIYMVLDSLGVNDLQEKFYSFLNQLYRTKEFDKIITSKESYLTKFEKNLELIVGQPGFKYNLQMPGLLIDTNSESIKGNMLSWQFEPTEAFFVTTVQRAESRIINLWAFVVSGLFLMGVLIFLLIPTFRRKK